MENIRGRKICASFIEWEKNQFPPAQRDIDVVQFLSTVEALIRDFDLIRWKKC